MPRTAALPEPGGDPTERLLLEREARSLFVMVAVVLVGFFLLAAQFVMAAPVVTRERIHAPIVITYFSISILLSLVLLALLWYRRWVRAVGMVAALFAATFAAVSGFVIWRSLAIDVPVAVLAKLPIASVGLAVIACMTLTLRPLHVVITGAGVAATLIGFFAVAIGDPRTTLATYSIEPYLGPSISRTRLFFELVFVATATAAGAFATQIARSTVRQAARLQRSTDQLSRYFSPDIAAGIRYAADNGATVINISLGSDSPSATILDAIRYAVGKGAFVAAAAGNEYEDGNPVEYPAGDAPGLDGLMSVAAVGRSGNRAFYSNTGSYVEIAAPGGDSRGGYQGQAHIQV